ncbi:MAG: hypothetical protein KKF48_00410 [Nanoarchaeota archaeon]|nr:hypothetical protein [Nanoarchaeota archaeon]MBU1027487.1 hypothetical protein [Nanoarchaeota archaeon]
MGVIRSSLLVIASAVLFVVFLAGNLFLTFSLSLDYGNIKAELSSVVRELAEQEINLNSIFEEKFPLMQDYCQNYSEYVFSEQGQTFAIPCDVVDLGFDNVFDYGVEYFMEENYYKDYNCGFWSCFGETEIPFFLVSKKAQDYWNGKFYYLLVVAIVLVALMFLLVEHKPNLLILVGALLTFSALLFRKLDWIFSLINKSFLHFLGVFFSRATDVFLISIIIGIVVLALGIIFRFLTFDFLKKKFSRKEVQEIVKEEVSKVKKDSKKK